jgi:integrase
VKVLQPTARKVGITKKIGWHTFRRTYSSLLAATGDDVKVVQELMRHAKISTTMEVYAQAGMEKKRAAQRRAVDVLMDRKPKNAADEEDNLESSQIVPASWLKFPEVAAQVLEMIWWT